MGSFCRKIKRNITMSNIVERKKFMARAFRSARLLWCTSCKTAPQNWNQTKRKPFPDGKPNENGDVLCAKCDTALVACDKLDLPPGCDGKGLWVRPPTQDGWGVSQSSVKPKEQAEIDLLKTMAVPEVGERPPSSDAPEDPAKPEGEEGGVAVEGGVR